jgi:general secretion pathway protein D
MEMNYANELRRTEMRAFGKTIIPIGVLLISIVFVPIPALADPILSIQPAFTTVGRFFDVFVDISGVSDLYAFQFDISFDPAILSANGVNESDFLPGGGATFFIPGEINNTAGTINFTADSLLGPVPGVSGNGTLAVISFQALALGTSLIDFSNVILSDSNLVDIAFFTTTPGSVTVSGIAVPEPATLLLICIGMAALGIMRKKEKEII